MRVENRALLAGLLTSASLVCLGAATSRAADPLEARLLEVSATATKLNKGSVAGVKVGQIFDLYREAEVYLLPLTNGKEPLVVPQKRIAQVQVFSVEPSTALARLIMKDEDVELVAKELRALLNPTAVAPNRKPEFVDGGARRNPVGWGQDVDLELKVSNEAGDRVVYTWSATGGRLRYARTLLPRNTWTAPPESGDYTLTVSALDSGDNEARTTITLRSAGVRRGLASRFVPSGRRYDGKSRYGFVGDVSFGNRGELLTLTPKQGWGSTTQVRFAVPWRYPKLFARKVEDRYLSAVAMLGVERGDYGAVFALDSDRNVVLRYDLNSGWGTFGRPPLVIGELGGGQGNARFSEPVDICVGPKGELYVLDAGQRCVQMFEVSRGKSARAQFLVSFGSPGEEKNELKRPVALAVGRDDVVHVLDAERRVVVMYRDFRAFSEISVGEPEEVLGGVAVDPFDSSIWVLSKSKGLVRRYARNGQLLGEAGGANPGVPSRLESPQRVRISPTRELWVVDREGNSLVRFDSEGRFLARTGGVELGSRLQVAGGPQGGFAVLDRGSYKVTRFDREGWIRAHFGGEGTKAGQFEEPIDLALGSSGDAFVLDAEQQRLHRFTPQGRAVGALSKGLEAVVDLSGVNDKSLLSVLQQKAKGNFALINQQPRLLRTFGRDFTGELTPRFGCVTGITGAVSGSGRESSRPIYWTCDDDRELLYRTQGGKPQAVDLEFDEISDVEPSPSGQVFVADPGDEQLVVISPDGRVQAQLQSDRFEEPTDVGVDSFGHVFVFDRSTGQVVELVPAGK